jgi:hypothetical protein
MYIVGINDTVYQYTLSTPWNVGTANYDSVSVSVNSQDSAPQGVAFNSDGSKMYIMGYGNKTVFQYTLSTPWNVGTATYDTISKSVSSQESAPQGVAFNSDGSKMYIVGITNDTVYQYTVGGTTEYDYVQIDVVPSEIDLLDLGDTPAAYDDGKFLKSSAADFELVDYVQHDFLINNFQYPDGGTTWNAQLEGAHLDENQTSSKIWVPLNFLKIGDEIVSYKIVGDVIEADTVTLDCKLVRVNKADPITTTDVAGGGITQVTADGNFDSEATLSSVETVATDTQYVLEVQGTTGTGDSITVIGAEVKINRKL